MDTQYGKTVPRDRQGNELTMKHQLRIQSLMITSLLCCAALLLIADDALAAQLQKATEHQTTEPFTIAVLPDTQFYCDTRLKLSAKWGNGDLRRYFFAQTEWVRDNQKRLNIAFLVHEGDIVQADAPEEWAIAKEAMSVLDGKVPYCMCLGNHDMGFEKADNKYGGNIGVNRTTHFNTYFPRDTFAKRREFGGTFDPNRHDNSWYHFEAAGMKFLIVSLECKPRDSVLNWANKIVSKHPDHRVIVLTHAYLNPKKSRNTGGGVKAKGNTGEQIWQKFVKKHENIFMVLCGHHSGEAVRTDTGDHGNQVHQILCDYQGMTNGGESWLRYMTFMPESNKISISTYNPALDKFRNGPSSRFDLDYPMTLLRKAKAANVSDKNHTVKALADRVRAHVNSEPLRFPNQHWVRGAYYAGLMAMYESTLDRAYLDDCMAWGKNVSWQIKEQGGGPYESGAYPLVCGQIWYGCYQANKDEMMMKPTLAFLEDPKVENPVSAPGKWYLENTGHRFVDGLFTAPPLLAMLYQMTGDEKYVDWMNACFWDVHKEIFDRDAGLFYRDARSKPRKTKNGKKVLWSRGNGWAFGGLTRILKYLPAEHPSYPKYKSLYLQMAESLAKRQQADGFWRSNLDDPEQYPMKESSGTGFFCYGIAWGINNGILDREHFLPVAKKAWTALALVVNEDGQVGWSQPAGGGPGKVAEADTSKFGTGIFLLAASEVVLLTQGEALAASKPLGLQPGPNATVLLNGKPYRGIGINYFNCFLRTLKDGDDTSYDEGFAALAEKGIPFARFCATGFWPRDMKLYVEDHEEYFRRLDGVVASAQKHGIGLIPSLFWLYACVPDLVGEPMDQWANPNSKTQAWMRNYVREVVTRYRDNPTIWAWELGNEFSLHANLPNAKDHRPKVHHSLGTPDARSARDDLTYEMVGKAFTAFATAVRKDDPHRLIFTGDSFPRLSAWHQEKENSWTHDTMEQFAEMLTKANPDPISGIGLHAYEDDDQRFDDAMAVARKLNKPIFIGEFGAQHETEPQAAKFRRLLKAVVDNDIPLAAVWVFDYSNQRDFNITTDNGRAWQLELIAETNRNLRMQTQEEVHPDVCVYGGTPGGITAAIAAAREGASVVLLEQTRHVGGLTTSGLNRDECNHLDRQTLGGLCEQFLEEAVKRSNGRWTEGNSRTWQSGIAERVFLEMLKEAGVEVRYEQLLDQVKKDGTQITELRMQGGEIYQANVFIDATYEGDLMAKAGVSYSVGRESAEHYGESIAGVRYLDDKVAISPFDDEGNLLFGVMPGEPPAAGSANEVPICYNVRLNITTDEVNRVPIEKPSSYDPMQHELLARALEAGLLKNLSSIIGTYSMGESRKRELNNRQFSIVSMSIPGAQTSWAEASFQEREAIHQQYRDYTHGMLWFLKTDPRVPKHIRDEMAPYGFCKDEWADNNHWPYYLYIRAARRMQGEVVLTEADIIEDRNKEDVIHIGSHFIDCHHAARYAVDSGHIINEGRIWKQGARFDIPYRAITPKAGECSNLLVPVCASASHVAFCTIRLEPTWMHLGEVAGIAAAMAAKSGKSVQMIDIKSLQARLLDLGIPLEHPEGPMAYEKKHGKPRTFAPNDVVKEFFASADKDGDGVASKSEWDSARPTWKWLFDHIDKDKNGQLDRAEYKAWQTYKKERPDWYKSLRDSLN